MGVDGGEDFGPLGIVGGGGGLNTPLSVCHCLCVIYLIMPLGGLTI